MERIVVVALDAFEAALARAAGPPPEPLRRLAASLASYACFKPAPASDRASFGRHGKARGAEPRAGAPRRSGLLERPRIGARDLSREALCRKDFLSLMNKLSPQNAEKIWKTFSAGMLPAQAPLYCEVLWALMQRAAKLYARLYADVALGLARALQAPHKMAFKCAWDARWAVWTAGAFWAVDAEAAAVAAAAPTAADEDNEWLAWKKGRLRLMQACVFLCANGVFTQPPEALLAPIAEACAACIRTDAFAFLDYYLDLLTHGLDALHDLQRPPPEPLRAQWGDWLARAPAMPPLCRFKVMHLAETYGGAAKGKGHLK